MVCEHLRIASFLSYLPTISPFVAQSKDSTDFSHLEERTEAESEGAPGDPDCVSLQGIGYTTAGMLCISLSCYTIMYIQMSQKS